MIRAVCRRILLNDSDADDATQNAMIAIVRGYETFDGRSAFSTWVYRIATNAALDELRRRRRRPLSLFSDDGRQVDVSDTHSDDQQLVVESSDYLIQALAQIPEEFRVALVLRDTKKSARYSTSRSGLFVLESPEAEAALLTFWGTQTHLTNVKTQTLEIHDERRPHKKHRRQLRY
jgi:RNA polymerase sigma factor (sigma-70 family)